MQNLNISDPVYGFVCLPYGLLTDLVRHPYVQRLSRIRQLGLSHFVYPGAQHTRFQHSLGAFHLMQEALRTLISKGAFIFDSEAEAAGAAILLHDIGHGPFSHVLERELVHDISHEGLSLLMMERINRDMKGELALAIKVFKNEYSKPFLHELLCSQLDVDRLDYLCRDTFYTGVREGNIGADRLIRMLNLSGEHLVVDAKGLYSVENYLLSRRLMYWQVYLHKTAVAAEEVLRAALRRAVLLASQGVDLPCAPHLRYFLYNRIDAERFHSDAQALDNYALLDDSDILSALKTWMSCPDRLLSLLATDFINRRLFKVEVASSPAMASMRLAELRALVADKLHLDESEAEWFVSCREVCKEMYSAAAEGIKVMFPNGEVRDVTDVSQIVDSETRDIVDSKCYLFRQRLPGE